MLEHENLNRFYGFSLDGIEAVSIWKYCTRGSIRDVITTGNNTLTRDQVFVHSIVTELCEAIHFLHNSPLQFHGKLRSECCLVDERWQVKVSAYGLKSMKVLRKQKARG
jgi:hypothetical protein